MNLVDIKKMNRNHVLQLVYQNKHISKPEIAATLGISLPTVTHCVNELKQMNLVTDKGFFESTGGRKAAIISFRNNVKMAIGVEILRDCVHLVALDLFGNIQCSKDYEILFQNNDFYCLQVGNYINQFFIDLNISANTLLGVGIAIQGLVNEETGELFFGRILDADGFSAQQIGRHISFPCSLGHDTELAAAFALWHDPSIHEALYLVLNKNVGGAVIINGRVHRNQKLPSGLIEHMTLVPNGRPCYCGKTGCVEAYLSSYVLLGDGIRSLDEFFRRLRNGDPACRARWQNYLRNLAAAIYNYQIIISTKVVLGGGIAKYLLPEDIETLKKLVLASSLITDEMPPILISKYNDAAAGAALQYIEGFLSQFGSDWRQTSEFDKRST